MSLFEKIERKNDNTTQRDLILLNMLKDMINELKMITEFSDSELKAISLLETDKYLQDLLKYYILNKKHVKRKYSAELREVLAKIAETAQLSSMANNNNQSMGV